MIDTSHAIVKRNITFDPRGAVSRIPPLPHFLLISRHACRILSRRLEAFPAHALTAILSWHQVIPELLPIKYE